VERFRSLSTSQARSSPFHCTSCFSPHLLLLAISKFHPTPFFASDNGNSGRPRPQCGFTPQYKGLQSIHDKYSRQGFSVLAFPCNGRVMSPIVKPLVNTNLQQQHCKHALVMRGQILGVLHLAGVPEASWLCCSHLSRRCRMDDGRLSSIC
jgi:hypothetical protein